MMWGLIALLFLITIGLTLVLRKLITPRYGDDVSSRFLERADFIPSKSTRLSRKALAAWLNDPQNTQSRIGYLSPVLFPFDIVFLLVLGTFLGLASVAFVEHLPALSKVPKWIWWLLPASYMVADAIEDSAIAGVLRGSIELTNQSYNFLSMFKAIKLATVALAGGQMLFLGLLIALLHFYPS
jgi:hypothetical protein